MQNYKTFRYNQSNDDYLKKIEELSKNNNLTSKQKREELKEIKPPDLVKEVEVKDIIVDQENEWRTNAVTWSTMEESDVKKRFTLEDGSFDEKKYNDYKTFMDVDDEINDLKTKINGYVNKEGNVYGKYEV